ncbi:regulatory protein RecX family protein [Striga hermonthica]|uniref:Regulatory protein RecX n=1 Tax=Striga hermonthica TaxID=68872 RepID=A0A9N7MXI7_STRHE|nr:regulatory protein RecX family protein [Striga hermonthica]
MFVHGLAIKLQYRVLMMSWVKCNTAARCCARGRDYSSAMPVKYIPRNSLKSEEDGAASLPVKYVEKRHNGPELNLARVGFSTNSSDGFLDVNSKNRAACRDTDMYGLNLEMEEKHEGDIVALDDGIIEETEEIVEDSFRSLSGIQSGPSRQAVEKLAIELLASRAFTALELKKKLQAKRFPLDIIESVMSDFQSRGLINDGLYAETYSRSRWSSSSWGPRRIRQVNYSILCMDFDY